MLLIRYAAQRSESAIRIHISLPSGTSLHLPLHHRLDHHRTLSLAPCAMQHIPTSYILHGSVNMSINKKIHTCTPVFTVALFTRARTCQQPKCPSTGSFASINMWYMYSEMLPSIKRRNKTGAFVDVN